MKLPYFAFLLCMFWFATPQSFGQSAGEILKDSVPLESLPGYKADFETLLPAAQEKPNFSTGSIVGQLMPDNSVRQRQDIRVTVKNGAVTITKIIANGKTYQQVPGGNGFIVIPGVAMMDLPVGFLADPANYKLTMRSDTFKGRKCFVLNLVMSEQFVHLQRDCASQSAKLLAVTGYIPIIASEERWIDADSHVVCQIVDFDEKGLIFKSTKYFNIQTNVNLSESLFDVGTNLNVIDTTKGPRAMSKIIGQMLDNRGALPNAANGSRGRNMILSLLILQVLGVSTWFLIRSKRKKTLSEK